jgi:hypothetical protein
MIFFNFRALYKENDEKLKETKDTFKELFNFYEKTILPRLIEAQDLAKRLRE